MRLFDPHIHMYSRTTDDYERMAVAGIAAVMEPAFWLGGPRHHPGTFFDYFEHLTGFEGERAARHGIAHFVSLSVNPREANDVPLAEAALAGMGPFLERECVVGIGEIGFDRITAEEERIFRRQVEAGMRLGLPLVVHTPHHSKAEGARRSLAIVKEMEVPLERVLIDHNTEETTGLVRDADGCWAGHTIYPITKLSPERAVEILKQYGTDRMMINSSADWGPSDPLAVPRTAALMRGHGFSEAEIQKVVWDNPRAFFAQSGRLRL